MSLRIISPGALTTVQDMGAVGHLRDGFPAAGVMDRMSAAIANILVGNRDDASMLEMTLNGASIEFIDRAIFAITGADMSPSLDGNPIPMNAAICAHPGSILTMGFAAAGLRTYFSVRGGIDVPPVLGSRSTNLKSGVGGFMGRKLAAGDILPVYPSLLLSEAGVRNRKIPYEPALPGDICVRAVLGPQDYRFDENSLDAFFSEAYTVTPKSDRMGIRLNGRPLNAPDGVDIISDGIVFGSVQVPKDGNPIILMADRQTTGGYAKIAAVIEADLPMLAQARPGDTVRFIRCTPDEAATAMKEQRKTLSRIRRAVRTKILSHEYSKKQ